MQKHGNRKRVAFIDAEQAGADATGISISDLQVDVLGCRAATGPLLLAFGESVQAAAHRQGL